MAVPAPTAPNPSQSGHGGRFTTLEAGRALAAALVVVHHATLLAAQPRHLGVLAFGGAPVFFNAGVDFFFVLSGFVIAFVHWGDLGRPDALPRYARARLTRIFPLYWAILIPLAAIYAAAPGLGEARQHDPLYVATSLVLWPMPQQPVLGVAWSLTFEMLFYLLFAGAIAAGRRALWLGAAWAVAIVGFGLAGGGRYPADFLLSPHNLQFLMGLAAAAWLRTRRAPAPWTLLGVGAAAFAFIVGVAEPRLGLSDPLAVALALGLAATLCVLGAVELERTGQLAAPAGLAALGGASYAVYLIHVVAQSFSIRLLLRAGLRQPEALVGALALIGIVAGVLCHRFVERPMLRALRRRPPSRPALASRPRARPRGRRMSRASRLTPTGWLTLEKLAQQGIWLVLFAVLAPILGPTPYGLFSLTMVVVGFCELVIVEAGAEALLTLPEATDAHVRTANLGNLLAGLLAAAVTCACAVPMAIAFRAPELAPMFFALAVLPVMSAFVASPTAALKREMRFKPFALRSILGLGLGGAAGVVAALMGAGVWALVLQVLVQRAAEVATLCGAAPGSVRLGWSRTAFADLWRCAANVFTARALMWFTGQIPRVIIGAVLGPTALGLFTLASRIVDVLVQVVLVPATQVARVEMRRFAEGLEGLEGAFSALVREMALFAFPVAVGLAAVAPTLFHLWLGPRWEGADTATQLIALTLLAQPVFYCASATLLALRRSHLDTVIQALLGASAVVATLAAAPFGLNWVCAALLGRLVVLSIAPVIMLRRAGGVRPWTVLRAPLGPLAAAAAMGLAVRFAQAPIDAAAGRILSLPLLVALGAAVYLPLAWLLVPVEARRSWAAVRAVGGRLRLSSAAASSV